MHKSVRIQGMITTYNTSGNKGKESVKPLQGKEIRPGSVLIYRRGCLAEEINQLSGGGGGGDEMDHWLRG